VENLWTAGANPVEKLLTGIFLRPDRAETPGARDVDDAFAIPFA
jgi:hypothetical protein